MRMLALPGALLLAFALYLPLPQVAQRVPDALRAGYRHLAARFPHGRKGDAWPALCCFLLLLAGVATLLCALHPVCAAVVCCPLLSALAQVAQSATIKRSLDGGALAHDIPAYEQRVRETCAAFAPAFVRNATVPLLLYALGTPLYLGGALAWMGAALFALAEDCAPAGRAAAWLTRVGDRVLAAMLALCAGVTGRNPLRAGGRGAQGRLMHILGIAGDETDNHAPVSGDLQQAAFLCCFCTVLLCALLTLAGSALC